MPIFTDSELVKSIRSGKILPVYFFYGKDVASVEAYAKKLAKKLCPDSNDDMNYHYFTGRSFSASEFADCVQALPIFSDRVLIMVNDINMDTLKADDSKYLMEMIPQIDPDTTTVIFYATGVDLCGGKKTLTAKNKKLADLIAKQGAVTEFAYKRPNELVKHIQSKCSDNFCVIHPKEAENLATMCLCNLLTIDNEIAKLCSYVGKGEITQEIIDDLVSGQLDTDAYKLANALVQGRSDEVFKILPELYAKQAEPIVLSSVISGSLIDIYRASLAYSTGRGQSDITADYNYKGRDFVVKNALRDCRKLPIEKVRKAISIMSDCDIDMKSKRTDPRVMLESALVRILGLR